MTELLEILRSEEISAKESLKEKSSDKNIQAVLFVADGVLYYRKNKDIEFNKYLRQLGVESKEIPDSQLHYFRRQAFIGRMTYEQYKTAVLKLYDITDSVLVSHGIQISLEERDKIQFFNGTLETLNILKHKNLYLGIVTDTAQPLHEKISKLERGGFGNLLDSITSSQEVGVQKPDPKIYQLAKQQLGITADQAVFVGHNLIELEGARSVGVKTVAFNYENGAKEDFYIKKFSELANLPILS
jgi:HAD superfamily hydrolase (TIGR01549 family)